MRGLLDVADQRVEELEEPMAQKRKRKYSPGVSKDVEKEMRAFNRGTARSGPGGKGGKVKSRTEKAGIPER